MKLFVVVLVSALTWCGLVVGIAVGAAFGTLASLSTLCVAFLNPNFHEELRRTEHATLSAIALAFDRARDAYARREPGKSGDPLEK